MLIMVWTPPLFWGGGLQSNDLISFLGARRGWKKWGDLTTLGGPPHILLIAGG